MVRRVVHQYQVQFILPGQQHQSQQPLAPLPTVLRAVVKVEDQLTIPFGLEVVVAPLSSRAALAAARERADQHRCLGVQRDPHGVRGRVRLLMGPLDVGEDGISLRYLFSLTVTVYGAA